MTGDSTPEGVRGLVVGKPNELYTYTDLSACTVGGGKMGEGACGVLATEIGAPSNLDQTCLWRIVDGRNTC